MKKAAIIIAVIIILGGGAFALMKHNDTKDSSTKPAATSAKTSSTASSNKSTTAQAQTTSSQATGTKFVINANDETADVKTLNVKKGDTIIVTFNVDTDNVYHGGLEFQSDVVSSKPIKPGASDTVTFTANKSFDFTPYWYQSQVKKDYVISVKVQ
jgi:uncharacterized protein YxeA